MMDSMQLLHEYAALQERLCDALFDRYPIEDTNLLLDLPKQGIMAVGDDVWEFQRHGLGVCFTNPSTNEVVDAHVDLADHRGGIDAWRLIQYTESKGIEALTHEGTEFDATQLSSLETMLEQLSHMGVLVVAKQKPRLYSLT
ncbi:MAG: hypothetical protein JST22_03140 [Bacteroidetes bacterium]|nr:hypothetical protein [Bacteroidota bacterium]